MPIVILMPALSPTMTQGHFVKWHCNVGDKVSPGQCLFEIETDKATMEVEAVDTGVLAAILVPDNTSDVLVGKPLAVLQEEGDTPDQLVEFLANAANVPSASVAESPPAPVSSAPTPAAPAMAHLIPLEEKRIVASPLAKKLAQQRGIDLSTIIGSGPSGRIVREDVEKTVPAAQKTAPVSLALTPMRATIAKRLTEAKQTIPHFYLSVDCKMDALLAFRASLNAGLGRKEITLNDLIARACVLALRDVPAMNSQWVGTHIQSFPQVDLAVAVSIEGGLITPIVAGAEMMDFKTFAGTLHHLIQRARSLQLKAHEYQGGTFTLSNMGMLGVDRFEAIINPPQAGILAVGGTKQRAIVENGVVCAAHMMTATLSADHRVIDGALGASFLTTFQNYIETPFVLLY